MQTLGTPYPATLTFDAPERIANWRPLVNWLEEERVESRTLRGDSTMVSVGMAYKVF